MRIAVYTCITAGKDNLNEDQNSQGADFIAFVDAPLSKTRWTWREAPSLFRDPRRNSRAPKILAHQYLSDYDYSLWIDGSIRLRCPVESLIEEYLGDSDVAAFSHFERDCLYDEAAVCAELALDTPELIREQAEAYRRAGYPEHAGLNELPILLRRHTAEIERLNNFWWSEFCRFSRRDQISFNYVSNKLGIQPATIPGTIFDTPLFSQQNHNYTEDQGLNGLDRPQVQVEAERASLLTRIVESDSELKAPRAELAANNIRNAESSMELSAALAEARLELALERGSLGHLLLRFPRAGAKRIFPPASRHGAAFWASVRVVTRELARRSERHL